MVLQNDIVQESLLLYMCLLHIITRFDGKMTQHSRRDQRYENMKGHFLDSVPRFSS